MQIHRQTDMGACGVWTFGMGGGGVAVHWRSYDLLKYALTTFY